MDKLRILFVCMGNICRSPTAEAVFRTRVRVQGLEAYIEADSAGTHAYHTDEPPDARAQAAAAARGIDLSELRARAVTLEDFGRFDYVLAMDKANLARLETMGSGPARLSLFMAYAPAELGDEIADPYFGGARGFEQVLDQVEAASDALIRVLRARHGIG